MNFCNHSCIFGRRKFPSILEVNRIQIPIRTPNPDRNRLGGGLRSPNALISVAYLPDLVITISVQWASNLLQSSRDSNSTLKSSQPRTSAAAAGSSTPASLAAGTATALRSRSGDRTSACRPKMDDSRPRWAESSVAECGVNSVLAVCSRSSWKFDRYDVNSDAYGVDVIMTM